MHLGWTTRFWHKILQHILSECITDSSLRKLIKKANSFTAVKFSLRTLTFGFHVNDSTRYFACGSVSLLVITRVCWCFVSLIQWPEKQPHITLSPCLPTIAALYSSLIFRIFTLRNLERRLIYWCYYSNQSSRLCKWWITCKNKAVLPKLQTDPQVQWFSVPRTCLLCSLGIRTRSTFAFPQ